MPEQEHSVDTRTRVVISIEESTYRAMVRKAGENRTSFSAEAEKAFAEHTKPATAKGRK